MTTPYRARTALAVGALLALTACGGGSDTASTREDGVRLVQDGVLTTCTHLPYPPFQLEQDGEIVGFDVELMDLVAADLGVEQEVVDTPFETIKTGADLNAGKCDVAAAGMTITEERQANLDFSDPYFDATQALLAKKGSGITSLEDAKGKRFGSQSATTGEDFARAEGIDPVSFETSDAELNGLKSGQVDVIIQDLPVVSEWLKDPANSDYEIVANLDTGEQYGFAVKKDGNDELLAAINRVLADARSDGSYDAIYEKWIGQVPTTS
ncbi:MAG TPA: transporter substrate-binding domain-containing protein [Mycobacteriales bacterium]|nr:transporter substrate-binding domain-containing protein [Mycobacteriales bacterium]